MIEKFLINLFVAIIELLVIFEMSRRFRCENKCNIIVALISATLYMIFSVMATLYINQPIIMLTVNAILLFAFTFLYNMKFYKRIIAIVTFVAISMAYELLVTLVIGAINNITPELIQLDLELYLLACLMAKFLLYFTIKSIIILIKPNEKTMGFLHNSLSLLMPMASFAILVILSHVVYSFNDITEKILVLISAILLIAANIGTFIIYDAIAKREGKIRKQQVDIVALELEKNEYTSLIASQIKSNKDLHDLKHKMYSIKEYIKNNDSRVNEVVDEICESVSEQQIIDYVGKADVNALLNVKNNLAKCKGISLKISTLISSDIVIDTMDLCVILGNIIDNSIEASDGITENREEIILELKTQSNYLAIKCINPTVNTDVNVGNSSKESGGLTNGFGLVKIQELTKKYDGSFSFDVSNRKFTISLLLKNCIMHP